MPEDLGNLPIHLELRRGGTMVFARETTTAKMKRTPAELVAYLTHELEFPQGVFLMTGTGIVPGDNFSLIPDDEVHIQMGSAIIRNHVL